MEGFENSVRRFKVATLGNSSEVPIGKTSAIQIKNTSDTGDLTVSNQLNNDSFQTEKWIMHQ